jgi:hypothetical protein
MANSLRLVMILRMARKLRVEYPGALYHVLNRGDRREPIFKDARDRQTLVDALAAVCARTGWQVQGRLPELSLPQEGHDGKRRQIRTYPLLPHPYDSSL